METTNPYAPPLSVVADTAGPRDVADGEVIFFPVSQTKLLVMSFCTIGLYQLYWFYKNWKIVSHRTGESMYPFWRAFFAIFYCNQLFQRVKNHDIHSSAGNLSAGSLAAVWIISTLLARAPDPFWLAMYAGMFALLPVQGAINTINEQDAPGHNPNTRFTVWNWIAVVIGAPFFVLILLGAFLPAHR